MASKTNSRRIACTPSYSWCLKIKSNCFTPPWRSCRGSCSSSSPRRVNSIPSDALNKKSLLVSRVVWLNNPSSRNKFRWIWSPHPRIGPSRNSPSNNKSKVMSCHCCPPPTSSNSPSWRTPPWTVSCTMSSYSTFVSIGNSKRFVHKITSLTWNHSGIMISWPWWTTITAKINSRTSRPYNSIRSPRMSRRCSSSSCSIVMSSTPLYSNRILVSSFTR